MAVTEIVCAAKSKVRLKTSFFCVWEVGARNERRASNAKYCHLPECEAKPGQVRNGINGRGGRAPVYAGFDLELARRSAMSRSKAVDFSASTPGNNKPC